jgi:hypothetical protein
MFLEHSSSKLAAYLDGKLTPQEVRETELHLRKCADCRNECERFRAAMEGLGHLPLVKAPDTLWLRLQIALEENQSQQKPALLWLRWAFVASLLLILGGGSYWRVVHRPRMRWDVIRLDGLPSVDAKPIRKTAQIGAGEWIETDAKSRAMVKVGEIGFVEVAPNTRVQVVAERSTEHRLALARGEIQATISAPPKLFFVETASGTAIDLGCEYALKTDEDGSGLLRVTRGWVSFQWKRLESLVPAGASCRMRPRSGPAIPYFNDAPENLKKAVDSFGVEKSRDRELAIVLAESRVRDTLTLWHLLSRVEPRDRERVYDRIAALTPVPAGISRELALKLDPQTLRHWKDELAWTW